MIGNPDFIYEYSWSSFSSVIADQYISDGATSNSWIKNE